MSKLRHRESWYSRTKKELEEMDYKEKYEKALEWMKSIYPTMQGSDKEDAEHYFPELKEENEDIRIINGLQGFLTAFGSDYFGTGEWWKFDDWLERQKEQIPYIDFVIKPHKGDDNNPYDMRVSEAQEYAIKRGFGIPLNDGEVYVDERHMTQTIGNILRWADEHPKEQKPVENPKKGCPTYPLSVVGDLLAEQKPAWSEEDEKMIKSISFVLESFVSHSESASSPSLITTYPIYYKEIDWLKSLRPSWKPSEEQMEALQRAVNKLAKTDVADSVRLSIVYDNLKKRM